MEPPDFPDAQRLERFRDYLRLLARLQLGARSDRSALTHPTSCSRRSWRPSRSATSFEAIRVRRRRRGCARSCARNVADALRAGSSLKRDVARERSLDEELDRVVSPPRCLARPRTANAQRARATARAGTSCWPTRSARLPERQREALVMHYWQGCSLAEIGASLDRSTSSVAGLLKRGLKHLRDRARCPDLSGASHDRVARFRKRPSLARHFPSASKGSSWPSPPISRPSRPGDHPIELAFWLATAISPPTSSRSSPAKIDSRAWRG